MNNETLNQVFSNTAKQFESFDSNPTLEKLIENS